MTDQPTHPSSEPCVSPRDDGRIDVTGPAEVRVRGGNIYLVHASVTAKFPAEAEVFVKVWPKEDSRS